MFLFLLCRSGAELKMLRACWLLDPQWVSSNDTVKKCTCAEESPDFDVSLPAFMDFSPTELPTTGGMTTGMTTASDTPSSTASATQTTNATTLRETTSTGWSLRTVSTVTQHAQEAAENSASTLKGATPQSQSTSKSLPTLSDTSMVNRNTTYVFLRTAKPTVPTASEGFTSPQLDKDQSLSLGSESTVRTTTEGLLVVQGTGLDSIHNLNQTSHLVEKGKDNYSKDGSSNAPSGDFAVGTTKRLPLNKKSQSAHYDSPYPSPQTNISLTNTIATSNPSNKLESVTHTDSTNLTANDAVTPKLSQSTNHVTMVTKSSSNVNSRTSTTSVKSGRSTSGRITSLPSLVLYSSVSSSSSSSSSVSSGGIHVSSRSSPAPHPHSSASPGLNSSRGVVGGIYQCLFLSLHLLHNACCMKQIHIPMSILRVFPTPPLHSYLPFSHLFYVLFFSISLSTLPHHHQYPLPLPLSLSPSSLLRCIRNAILNAF